MSLPPSGPHGSAPDQSNNVNSPGPQYQQGQHYQQGQQYPQGPHFQQAGAPAAPGFSHGPAPSLAAAAGQTRKPRRWVTPVVAIATFLFGLMVGSAGNGGSTAATPSAVPPVTVTAAGSGGATVTVTATTEGSGPAPATTAKTEAPAATGSTVGDGTWKVGSEVQPGTYKTVVPDDSIICYYALLSSADNQDIIRNDLVSAGKQAYTEIPATAKFFETSGCGEWTKVE